MLTKPKIKLIKLLHEKRHRNEHGLFLVEGEKSVAELLKSDFEIDSLFITARFKEAYAPLVYSRSCPFTVVEQPEIEMMGTLESSGAALAVVKQKKNAPPRATEDRVLLALDDIRDPGNLGTIVRIADWYGISDIIASETTADRYNPKTIAASMGSFTRVNVFYANLVSYLPTIHLPLIGAFLKGEDVHATSFPTSGILVIGNEANGISPAIEKIIKTKVTIPTFGHVESLNAAVSTGIVLDNWKRTRG